MTYQSCAKCGNRYKKKQLSKLGYCNTCKVMIERDNKARFGEFVPKDMGIE